MSAQQRERLARRLHRIAKRGALVSPSLLRGEQSAERCLTIVLTSLSFYQLSQPSRDGWRHLADWVFMDRKAITKGLRT